MDLILPIFFKFGIFTIGTLFVLITIARLTKPSSVEILKKLQSISKNKTFQKVFFSAGFILGLVGGLIISGGNIIATLAGSLSGIIYFGLIFAVINTLYEYMKDDEE